MLNKRPYSIHYHAVFQWFIKIFVVISLLFCCALFPLFLKMKNNFSELQAEKRKQLLSNGATQISSTVSGILRTSSTLRSDSRFSQLRYKDIDYNDISITTQNQLQKTFEDLILPFNAIAHAALQLDKEATITNDTVFFENQLDYYPNFFQVNNMDYNEWIEYLSEVKTGFTPVCHIKTYSNEYDAIMLVTPWVNNSYLYACINVSDFKKLVIEEKNLNNCYITITSVDNEILYSDLPRNVGKHQTFSEFCSAGQIKISVHIPNNVFYNNMQSFYLFFSLYMLACIILLISVIIFGTKHAAKPITNIIDVLEQSRNLKPTGSILSLQKPINGFDYIANSIINADQNIEQYQTTLRTQQKILQARFFEKAINGQLVSKNDIHEFYTYFPEFPKSYYMLLIRLWSYASGTNATLYSEPLLLLQAFLETELSYVYQQQINETELLLVLSKEDYENSYETLNFMIKNINQEEPTYHTCCIASDVYHHLEDLPTAYQQLRAMDGLSFTEYQTHVCTVTDYLEESKIPVTMIDLMTLYTAVTSGNSELALNRLSSYSHELNLPENIAFAKPVFDIIKGMLNYIKIDYSMLLVEQHIPTFQLGRTIDEQLSETVTNFCNLICEYNNVNKDSFTQELLNYIDVHYTDCDICLTSLKTHFKCSESTIRKSFKRITDIPIARYIEKKRMLLANELLAQNKKTVTEIALECGYSLPHSFYKAYKRVYGHAPTLPNSTQAE